MAIDGALAGLFVGADHRVIYRNYAADGVTPLAMTGWTIVLEFRKTDISGTILKTVTGVVTGTFNVDPLTNTEICTFILTDDDLAATIFKGDDPVVRYSIKRTDAGVEQPLRYGDAPITRVTQV